MKRDAALQKRKPLQEKRAFGCIPARRCYICGRGIVEKTEPVSGATCTFVGFRYLGGEEYMVVEETTQLTAEMYAGEGINTAHCACDVPLRALAPIGTTFSLEKPFGCARGCWKPLRLFQPVFTEYAPFAISAERIIRRQDSRTTCMIKNLPNKLTAKQLVEVLSSIYYNAFDFLYLRMDFKSRCNNGYAFVNFRQAEYIPIFLDAIQGKRWKNFRSDKRGDIAYARIQGMAMLQNRFKRSDILQASPEYWPLVFDADGQPIRASEWKAPR